MGKQNGIIQLKGTIGNITFYETQDGFLFKKRTRLTKNSMMNGPHAARIKENQAEFGESTKSSALIRNAFRWLLVKSADNRISSRLAKTMHSILKLDGTSPRGARNVGTAIALPTASNLLKGFNFNKNANLSDVLHIPFLVNTVTGVITINGLIPLNDVTKPNGATHMSITGAWSKVDFSGKIFNSEATNVVNLPIDGASTNVTLTPVAVPTGTGTNVFVVSVEFLQIVNGIQYPLNNRVGNALAIVALA